MQRVRAPGAAAAPGGDRHGPHKSPPRLRDPVLFGHLYELADRGALDPVDRPRRIIARSQNPVPNFYG